MQFNKSLADLPSTECNDFVILSFFEKPILFNERKSKIDLVNIDGIFLLKVLWVIIKANLVLKLC